MSAIRKMTFGDNAVLPVLYGNHDRNLVRIEQLAGVKLSARGNQLEIVGDGEDAVGIAHKALTTLYERLKRGLSVEMADIDAAIRFARAGAENGGEDEGIRTRRRTIQARTPGQRGYLEALRVRALNKRDRQKDKPTNVLSYPSGEAAFLGDIVLARQTVWREARMQNKSPADHLAHLVVHGTLHLQGHDHETSDADAERMEALERRILARLGIADPY